MKCLTKSLTVNCLTKTVKVKCLTKSLTVDCLTKTAKNEKSYKCLTVNCLTKTAKSNVLLKLENEMSYLNLKMKYLT
jgi:hypothetical protein